MKKILFSLAMIVIVAFTLTSCKKDYTCSCTIHDSSGYLPDQTITYQINNAKKSDAKSACSGYAIVQGTLSYTCNLQ